MTDMKTQTIFQYVFKD